MSTLAASLAVAQKGYSSKFLNSAGASSPGPGTPLPRRTEPNLYTPADAPQFRFFPAPCSFSARFHREKRKQVTDTRRGDFKIKFLIKHSQLNITKP